MSFPPSDSSPLILALDTATLQGSVALATGGTLLAEASTTVTTHSQTLLGLVEQVLSDAGRDKGELGGVVCGAGPGSFTGLRIGASTAKGLAYGFEIPLYSISSLHAMAMAVVNGGHCQPGDTILPVLDARKKEVYAVLLQVSPEGSLTELAAPCVLAPDDLSSYAKGKSPWVVGDALKPYAHACAAAGRTMDGDVGKAPLARDLLTLFYKECPQPASLFDGQPRYIRKSEAELKWNEKPSKPAT